MTIMTDRGDTVLSYRAPNSDPLWRSLIQDMNYMSHYDMIRFTQKINNLGMVVPFSDSLCNGMGGKSTRLVVK